MRFCRAATHSAPSQVLLKDTSLCKQLRVEKIRGPAFVELSALNIPSQRHRRLNKPNNKNNVSLGIN